MPVDDVADDRVVGRQPGVGPGDDEELAAAVPGGSAPRLRHRDGAVRVARVARRRVDGRVAGPAVPGLRRVAALDHEAGDDRGGRPCCRRSRSATSETNDAAAFGDCSGVEPDREAAAVRVHRDVVGLRRVERLRRLRRLARLRPGRLGRVASGGRQVLRLPLDVAAAAAAREQKHRHERAGTTSRRRKTRAATVRTP